MGMGMGMGMGAMPATQGQGGLTFAQTDALEESRETALAQLAVILANLPEEDTDTVENYMVQLDSAAEGEEQSHETILAQIGVDESDSLAKLATILVQLDD